MESKQPHNFFIILGEDSWGTLLVIPCERMIKENCFTAKVMYTGVYLHTGVYLRACIFGARELD